MQPEDPSEGTQPARRYSGAGARGVGADGTAAGNAAGDAPAGARDLPEAPDGPFLLYAGTASEWQGAEIFARAMHRVLREVPDARLVYLGQGSSWPALRALAAELPAGSVELRDPVDAATSAIWQRAARAAVVSLKPGIGYDFAMPTKMFAALACGTPVVFAGPGPAAQLVRAESLGTATDYHVDQVATAMAAALRTPPTEAERDRLAAWVLEHRSLAAVGRRGAAAIAAAAGPV